VPDVADDPDDLREDRGIGGPEAVHSTARDPATQHLAVRGEGFDERLVDDDDVGRVGVICGAEDSAAEERDVECVEGTLARDDVGRGVDVLLGEIERRAAGGDEALHRRGGHEADGGDPGVAAQRRELFLPEAYPRVELRVRGAGERGRRRDDVPRVHARVLGRHLGEAPHHQAGTDEEHERERHFGGDQRAPDPHVAVGALLGRAEGGGGAVGRHPERGEEPEGDRRDEGEPQREEEDSARELDLVEAGQRPHAHRLQHPEHQRGDTHARDGPRGGQDAALGEELADDPAAGRAERRAHRDFSLAGRASCEDGARQIGARHEQHEPGRCPKEHQRLADGSGLGLEERLGHGASREVREIFDPGRLGASSNDAVDLVARGLERDAVGEETEHVVVVGRP